MSERYETYSLKAEGNVQIGTSPVRKILMAPTLITTTPDSVQEDERSRGFYRPFAHRLGSIIYLVLIALGLIGLLEYTVRVLPHNGFESPRALGNALIEKANELVPRQQSVDAGLGTAIPTSPVNVVTPTLTDPSVPTAPAVITTPMFGTLAGVGESVYGDPTIETIELIEHPEITQVNPPAATPTDAPPAVNPTDAPPATNPTDAPPAANPTDANVQAPGQGGDASPSGGDMPLGEVEGTLPGQEGGAGLDGNPFTAATAQDSISAAPTFSVYADPTVATLGASVIFAPATTALSAYANPTVAAYEGPIFTTLAPIVTSGPSISVGEDGSTYLVYPTEAGGSIKKVTSSGLTTADILSNAPVVTFRQSVNASATASAADGGPTEYLESTIPLAFIAHPQNYFYGVYLPVLLAVLLRVLIGFFYCATKLMEPFYQLANRGDVPAKDFFWINYLSPNDNTAPFIAMVSGHWLMLWSSVLYFLVQLLSPFASELIHIYPSLEFIGEGRARHGLGPYNAFEGERQGLHVTQHYGSIRQWRA